MLCKPTKSGGGEGFLTGAADYNKRPTLSPTNGAVHKEVIVCRTRDLKRGRGM